MTASLKVNGETHDVEAEADTPLLYVLRNDLGLNAAKFGCGLGQCGACTVLLDGRPVRSCIILAVEADGAHVTTVEGLAQGEELHPLQRAFIEHGAVQCGFCIPGMLLASKALLDGNPNPDEEEVRYALGGHICRCGGYGAMGAAVAAAAKKPR